MTKGLGFILDLEQDRLSCRRLQFFDIPIDEMAVGRYGLNFLPKRFCSSARREVLEPTAWETLGVGHVVEVPMNAKAGKFR